MNRRITNLITPLVSAICISLLAGGCEDKLEPPVDGDQHTYATIIIGDQEWLKRNLMTTKLNDGTPIQLITDASAWEACTTPAYCFYNNDPGNKDTYGLLYNWYAVNTGKLCPRSYDYENMHVPSVADWAVLIDFVGTYDAGSRLKEQGLAHWASPNSPTPDPTQFLALPGGKRDQSGAFSGLTYIGQWWSSSETNANGANSFQIYSDLPIVANVASDKRFGYSVRCVQP